VDQTLTSVAVTPASVTLEPSGTQQFIANGLDQFGNAMATQPAFTWSLDPLSAGSVSSTGLYTAPNTSGEATVRATADLLISGTASVVVQSVTPTPPTNPIPIAIPPAPPLPLPNPTSAPLPIATPTPTPVPTPVPTIPAEESTAIAATTDQALPNLPAAASINHSKPTDAAPAHATPPATVIAAAPAPVRPASAAISAATSGITSGLVAQFLIPGSIMAGIFASMPAWNWVDPVSILKPSARARNRSGVGGHTANRPDESKLEDLLQ
jgi:hypothetical protein